MKTRLKIIRIRCGQVRRNPAVNEEDTWKGYPRPLQEWWRL